MERRASRADKPKRSRNAWLKCVKFLKPEELRGFLADTHVVVDGPFGVVFDPLSGRWSQSHDADVNYMMTVGRAAA